MLEFFDSLNFSQVCLYAGIFATAFFVIKMILFTMGGDGSDDMGIDITDTDAAFSVISLQGVLAFFMAFGWCGWVAQEKMGYSVTKSVLIAMGCGIFLLLFTAILMNALKKMNRVVETDLKSLIGQTGTAYTKFEPDGHGQIQIELNEKLATLPAVNKSNEHIEFTDIVKVMDVVDDILYIEKA